MSAVQDKELLAQLPLQLAEYFDFLDDLRVSGETNMFGARPYLMREYTLAGNEAAAVLSAWMKTFDGEASPEDRAALATLTTKPETTDAGEER